MRAIDKPFGFGNLQSAAIAFACIFAAVAIFHLSGLRERLDNTALDAIQRFVRTLSPRPAIENVVIVGIDEETERRFTEPLALWHQHLGDALAAIAQGHPKLVALDIVMPQRSYDGLVPGLDEQLVRGLAAVRGNAKLVVGLRLNARNQAQTVNPLLLAAAGSGALSLAYGSVDRDNTARRFVPLGSPGPQALPLLAERAATAIGIQPQAGIIDFSCGKMFSYVPMHEVISWAAEKPERLSEALSGKIVLIGEVGPDEDPVRQPLSLANWAPNSAAPPGVVLLAQTLRALESERIVSELPASLLAALTGLAALLVLIGGLWRTWAATAALLAALGLLVYLSYLAGVFVAPAAPIFAAILAATIRSVLEGVEQRRERLAVERQFGGYVSHNLLQAILAGEVDPTQPRKYANLAFLFADLRGFTTLTEKLPPYEVLTLLNRYYEGITPVIHAYDGTIDNFRGDGILAIFGAPRVAADAPCRAVRAARDMFASLDVLNVQLAREGRGRLDIGIGIDCGDAVVGNVGTTLRHGYSAVGDAVNVASRLQSFCKPLKMHIVVSSAVVRACPDEMPFIALGRLDLSGHAPVDAFGLAYSRENVASDMTTKSIARSESSI